jgi:pimeloyl-ACP methyl ester carboxylesterase
MSGFGTSFETRRLEVRPGVELAFWHEGVGGQPLVLAHGWPETKRIWARNIEPLAKAGFEVIAPDLRGFGESSLAPDGFYDLAAHARDLAALLECLGHSSCVASGGDMGGGVIIDLGLRFPGLVERQVLFNCILPLLPEMPEPVDPRVRAAADYYVRQSRDADCLACELDSPARRRSYIAEFYGHRFWATPGAFTRQEVDYMTEPFADPNKLRAGWANYEAASGTISRSETPRWFERSPVPAVALYGPDDHVLFPDFPERCELVFTNLVGPFVVPRSGHFMQWERAHLLNQTLVAFARSRDTEPPNGLRA